MYKIVVFVLLFIFSLVSYATEGLMVVASDYDVTTTADRFEKVLLSKGITIFARIDHSAGAATVAMELNPTHLIIFGNPKMGTPLMHCAPSVAIDLPLKALIWQDAENQVYLAYNKPGYLKQRHAIEGCDAVLVKMEQALANFAKVATQDD